MILCALHVSGIHGWWGEGLRDRAHTSSFQLMAEVLCRGNGSRDLINAG